VRPGRRRALVPRRARWRGWWRSPFRDHPQPPFRPLVADAQQFPPVQGAALQAAVIAALFDDLRLLGPGVVKSDHPAEGVGTQGRDAHPGHQLEHDHDTAYQREPFEPGQHDGATVDEASLFAAFIRTW
jgi:hypothetical protein